MDGQACDTVCAGPTSAATPTAERVFRRARLYAGLILIALLGLAFALPWAATDLTDLPAVIGYLFRRQDVYLLPFVLAFLLLQPRRATAWQPHVRGRVAPAVAVLLVVVCWVGHYLVFENYGLSRDEAMAQFDTYILGHGRFVWPFPPQWRVYADALNQTFVLPLGRHDAWVSTYLPVNAGFRALVGSVGDVWLTGPLFTAIGALALWGVAGRLFPASPASRIVTLGLYAGSSQIIFTGMTAYAMSGHLCLNLLWLWLFLRGGRAGHAGAIAIGFLATGLHQPLFHPMFVAPIFLEVLLGGRRWHLLTIYLVAYAAIGLFWLAWPDLLAHGYGASEERQKVDFLTRLIVTIHWFDPKAAWVMALNLIRFATWQHLLLLPLLAIGFVAVRGDAMGRALAIGLVFPVIVMAVLLPVQGHGWGYRYLHGVLGNACLVGGYGWRWLETRGLDYRRALLWSSLVSFGVVIPAHAVMARRMVDPYAIAARAIAALPADIVVVDDHAALWAGDLVINRPDLTNRPIRLAGSQLRPGDMAELCHGRTIAFFGADRLRAIAALFPDAPPRASGQADLQVAAKGAGCAIVAP